jgi:hypothetical protein
MQEIIKVALFTTYMLIAPLVLVLEQLCSSVVDFMKFYNGYFY